MNNNSPNGYSTELSISRYVDYADNNGEIKKVNIGSKRLYELFKNNIQSNKERYGKSFSLEANHKEIIEELTAQFGSETLVEVSGKSCRRLQLDIMNVCYKELQDHILGDFVFTYKGTLIVLDVVDYDQRMNSFFKDYLLAKLVKMKKRSKLFQKLAQLQMGNPTKYLSIVWNGRSEKDLLEFIDEKEEENISLRRKYNEVKENKSEVSKILTQIHVKTNIFL